MRKLPRYKRESICGIMIDNKVVQGSIENFSKMGALINTNLDLAKEKYVSIMYRNEKNEMLRILSLVVHSKRRGNVYQTGLFFINLESRI